MRYLWDGRIVIAIMIGCFLVAFFFNMPNRDVTLASIPLVSKIFITVAAAALLWFLVKTWILRR